MLRLFAFLVLLTVASALNCTIHEYKFAYLYNDVNKTYDVHGLWPEVCCNYHGYPFFCHPVTFDINVLKPILPSLLEVWFPTYNQSQQLELMEHEYVKHGSCTDFSLLEYFETALCLNAKTNTSSCQGENCYFPFIDDEVCGLIYQC